MENESFKPHTISLHDIFDVSSAIGEMASGLVLLSGSTGSGKTTSLASIAYDLKTKYKRQPIGVQIGNAEPVPGIRNIEFHGFERLGNLFNSTEEERMMDSAREEEWVRLRLLSILKEDPSIVFLDGMFDASSVLVALSLAEAGTLVIASTHASSPMEAIERIDGMLSGHPRYHVNNLVNTIRLSVHQKLVHNDSDTGRVMEKEILSADTELRDVIRSWG